jgi:hypothetical protein
MAGIIQNLLKDAAGGFFGNEYVRDYSHAAKTFRTNSYQNAPKYKFLFHVYFEINPAAYSKGIATGDNFGLEVKTISLPKYTFDTHVLNQYNRKRIVQTKLKYSPINISFHDDNGNTINDMWYNYYTYYYKDANKPVLQSSGASSNAGSGPSTSNVGSADYNTRNLYAPDITGNEDWGYIGESGSQSGTVSQASQGISKIPFFKSIQIYGFNQHSFIQYTLINPIITSFEHDTYSYSEASGVMENKMTIDYETVKYAEGALNGNSPSNTVPGFGMETNYDRTPSPIARPGSNATILGPNGLVDAGTGVLNDLANGNILGAIRTAGTAYNTFKNTNLKQLAKSDLNGVLVNATQQALPGAVRTNSYYPGYGTSPSTLGTAGAPNTGLQSPPNISSTGSGAPNNAALPPGRQTG